MAESPRFGANRDSKAAARAGRKARDEKTPTELAPVISVLDMAALRRECGPSFQELGSPKRA